MRLSLPSGSDAIAVGAVVAGSTLSSLGLLKIALHTSPVLFEGGPICGSTGGAAALWMLQGQLAHCWGCPAALAGLGLIMAALAVRLAAPADEAGRGSRNGMVSTAT